MPTLGFTCCSHGSVLIHDDCGAVWFWWSLSSVTYIHAWFCCGRVGNGKEWLTFIVMLCFRFLQLCLADPLSSSVFLPHSLPSSCRSGGSRRLGLSTYLWFSYLIYCWGRRKTKGLTRDTHGGVWLSYLNQFIGHVDLERSQWARAIASLVSIIWLGRADGIWF